MTVIIQGAMDEETDFLKDYFKPYKVERIAGYDFHIAHYKNSDLIISQTGMGIINASICTALGIQKFSPDLIINQGCAGGHVRKLSVGDLIIGESSVYINDFKTCAKAAGCGSDSLCWTPGSRSYKVDSTPRYVSIANGMHFDGSKYIGILGSGDLFSRETDRIKYLHDTFGELCEDMESVAALKACELFGIDRLALRIISNNELTGEAMDYGVCETMQKFVVSLIDEILNQKFRPFR